MKAKFNLLALATLALLSTINYQLSTASAQKQRTPGFRRKSLTCSRNLKGCSNSFPDQRINHLHGLA